MRHRLSQLVAALSLMLCPVLGIAAPQYIPVDLGEFGGPYLPSVWGNAPRDLDVNNARQVVGTMPLVESPDRYHGFLWADGQLTDLGTLPGTSPLNNIRAHGINSLGQITGWSAGNLTAFLWEAGAMAPLNSGPLDFDRAFAINDQSQIVGSDHELGALDVRYARVWDNGVATTLPSLPTEPSDFEADDAWDINDAGTIVGRAYAGVYRPSPLAPPTDFYHAVRWNTDGSVDDLGLGAATALNELGQIVGFNGYTPAGFRATLWNPDGAAIDLCASGNCDAQIARDINESGQVVGDEYLWSAGKVFDIHDLLVSADGWSDLDLHAINDRGDIAGIGRFQNEWHNVLLTVVPEPPFAGIVLIAGLLLRRRLTEPRP